jgi:hypothetical protein
MNHILVVLQGIANFDFDDLNEEQNEDFFSLTNINNCIKNDDLDLKTCMLTLQRREV